ncbi:MAG: DUF2828 family protein [Spirochaetia bacterium]|nr:DUF2828 family protein [Spirochaetia bacterium]
MNQNQFVNAVENGITETTNGMPAFRGTDSKVLDFFYKAPGYRKDQAEVKALFIKALEEDQVLALRVAKWLRDVRGGAGERQSFRTILKYAAENLDTDILESLAASIIELGRWDDLWTIIDLKNQEAVANKIVMLMVEAGIEANCGLMFKWMPRKGPIRLFLEKGLGLTSKQYRKMVVDGSKVVETQMCAKKWDEINFSQVPSIAASRYRKAFARNTPKYKEYLEKLTKAVATNDFTEAHVNTGAIFPHDVIPAGAMTYYGGNTVSAEEKEHAMAQWAMLPNFVGSMSILPIIDSSGSMCGKPIGNRNAMTIAASLGLYLAEKNTGVFKNVVCNFSDKAELKVLAGNLFDKLQQIQQMPWGMNTNLESAVAEILSVAKRNNVPQKDMPESIIILSDMQFDACVQLPKANAMDTINWMYEMNGYNPPVVIFWNIASSDNVPVKIHDTGVALFSGYSPSIMKSLLETDGKDITPYGMMLKTIMTERYN